MVDRLASPYPYSADRQFAVPAAADWLDPMVGLSFVEAATDRIEIATGVLLAPEHNPVLLAKQAASLDVLSGGRLTVGVGIGWSREEFAALGIPFARLETAMPHFAVWPPGETAGTASTSPASMPSASGWPYWTS